MNVSSANIAFQVKDLLQALTSNLELMRIRPGTLCPKMDDSLEQYGLKTLVDLVDAVEVENLVSEMRETAAAVVEHLPFAARQLIAALSRPGQAAPGSRFAEIQLSHCFKVRTIQSWYPKNCNSDGPRFCSTLMSACHNHKQFN